MYKDTTVSNLTGNLINAQFKTLPTGEIICNPRSYLDVDDWDSQASEEIASGVGFRIIEKGKTDEKTDPGMFSIHSPLYGSDWKDENAHEDKYSCECGYYIGHRYMDNETICPKCKQPVRYIDVNLLKTGWFILDRDQIIHPTIYLKMVEFFNKDQLDQMLSFYSDIDTAQKKSVKKESPFRGIGIIEFISRYREILDHYYINNSKSSRDLYEYLIIHESLTFVHSIPCFNKHLRKFVIQNGEIKYSDEDKVFQKIYSDHILLNNNFEWERRKSVREKRKKDLSYLRRENILLRLQKYVVELWNYTFETISKKEGVINQQILGGRLNFTARNVIIPDPTLRIDHCSVGYTTFMVLMKFELCALMHDLYKISYDEANSRWDKALVVQSDSLYNLMIYLIEHNNVYLSVDRNPSINYGSYTTLRIVKVDKDIHNYCLGLSPMIIRKQNADFDGDIECEIMHKIGKIAEEYHENTNPRSNMGVSHNDGRYDTDCSLFKDGIVGLHAFLNI